MFRLVPRTITSCLIKQKCFYSSECAGKSNSVIEVNDNDGVREIILNDSKTRNSLSCSMMDSIIDAVAESSCIDSLRCIILSAKGPVFSAGHNFKEIATDCEMQAKIFNKCSTMIETIQKAPIPVIAKVNGIAAAAGCQLVASCDIGVCTDKSMFSTPGVNFGLFCHTPGVAISRTMPRMKASYMLITGNPISAQEAYIAGLMSKVVPVDKIDEEICKICESIKTKSRIVVKMGKEFFQRQLELKLQDAYTEACGMMVKNLSLQDGQEGLKSFLEKRKPKWENR